MAIAGYIYLCRRTLKASALQTHWWYGPSCQVQHPLESGEDALLVVERLCSLGNSDR